MRTDDPRRPRTSASARSWLTALLVVLIVVLTGCSTIPSRGPVGTIPASDGEAAPMAPAFSPAGPAAGSSPQSILRDFITAGTGAGDGYSVARQFLSPSAALSWRPEERIVVFSEFRVEQREAADRFQIQLETTGIVDARGIRTDSAEASTETINVGMVQVDGEWRIDDLPDGIMLLQSSAQDLLIPRNLYFYSSNYEYWVPDARWFVRRTGVTARILSAMLTGPAPYLQGAVTSAFPEGVTLARDSVPITSGRASVELSPEVLENATSLRLQQMDQQLLTNLLGLNDVTSVEMTSGQPIDLGATSAELVVPELTPDVGGEQVAVAGKELVRVRNGAVVPIDGLPSVSEFDPRDPATAGSGSAYAFLDADRTSLFVTAPESEARAVVEGRALTQPSFDPGNWVWTARTAGDRSEILTVPPGGDEENAVVLTPGWLGDRTVREVRVSRDGSRALLVTDRAGVGEVLLSGIIRSAEGVPQTLTSPLVVPTDGSIDTAKWAGQSEIVASSVGAGEAAPIVLHLDGESEEMAGLEGVLNLSAGSDAENTFYAQVGGTLYKRIGNSWVDAQLEVVDPAFPG
ncbi:hypothetical protein AC792_05410 [Arthrobacter sp. RIT-PI-e]|uniref:LpqB family beta-propeller domain-containing protein n=1 Tax=Arthrobacter sp. RIT-PI-e TaxID=1681197 RepID=UPI00067692E4|nr:LpqB family beta-propeller domain-containing protein [Arthrobacter sp. RIT-PI-e]KNC19541.1 hypothetical protein AC792_05410 [Arthrobacter sp. RIT-PI-e]